MKRVLTSHPVAWTLAAVLLVGLAMRLWRLDNEALWVDELVFYAHLDAPTFAAFIERVRAADPPMTPGYFTLGWLWAHAIGDSVVSLRVFSVLLATPLIPLVFLFTRRWYGNAAGLFAAMCVALALNQTYYAQELRMYALVLPLAALSMLAFGRAQEGRGRPWWMLNVLCNSLLLGCHLLTACLLLAQGLALLATRPRAWRTWLPWGLAHGPAVLALAWWISTIDDTALNNAASGIGIPSLYHLPPMLILWAGARLRDPYSAAAFYPGGISFDIAIAVALFALAGIAATVALWPARRWLVNPQRTGALPRETARLVVLVAWLVVPIVTLFVLSWLVRPVLLGRYTLLSAPALFILAGAGFAVCHRRAPRVATAGALLLAAAYLYQWALFPGPLRLDWPGAIAALSAVEPSAEVAVIEQFSHYPFSWHAQQRDAPAHLQHAALYPDPTTAALAAARRPATPHYAIIWWWFSAESLLAPYTGQGLACTARPIPGGAPPLWLVHCPAATLESAGPELAGP